MQYCPSLRKEEYFTGASGFPNWQNLKRRVNVVSFESFSIGEHSSAKVVMICYNFIALS